MTLLTPVLATGSTINFKPSGQFSNLSSVNAGSIIGWALSVIVILAGVIFFFMLVIGGIKWITSGGDKTKTEGARNQITAALVGLVIVFAAWAIVSLIGTVFGVDLLNFTIPTLDGTPPTP